MKAKRSSPFKIKNPYGKLTGFGHIVLGCTEIDLACPWFIVATTVRNNRLGEFDQQFLSWDAERLSELLEVLEDEQEQRRVYVVSAIYSDPRKGMRIDRLREIWRATDGKHPLNATMVYVLDDGHQFIRQIDCEEPAESPGASRLLLRV